ncbi:uncharacterized protein [Nicotiana tomentosiformis]|uniref:uncharacterized protein n=1 Tax=Nicotiana tomentosiformis TaxID=4098 RepID=UPI00388C862C
MSDKEQKRLEQFGRLRPPSFSGAESEDAQDFLDREKLRRQFEQLCQEGMSVTQYEMRFSELDHHTIWLVPTERERIRRFIDGHNYGLCFVMTQEIALGARFDEVVDIARRLDQSHHNMGRPYSPAQMAHPVHRGASASHGSYSARPGQLCLSALPAQSSSRAPSVQGSSVPGPSSSYASSRGPI